VHQSHAKLFYALEALGKEEALHSAVFSEMHDKKNFMFMQGNEKETLAAHGLKMGQLAPAVRVAVCGRAQTPSLDAVLALFPRQVVRDRLRKAAEAPL